MTTPFPNSMDFGGYNVEGTIPAEIVAAGQLEKGP